MGILGIFLVFISLQCVPKPIDKVGKSLTKHMSLFFVPAIVAIIEYFDVILANVYAIFGAVIVSTMLSLAITAWLSQKLLYALNPRKKPSSESTS